MTVQRHNIKRVCMIPRFALKSACAAQPHIPNPRRVEACWFVLYVLYIRFCRMRLALHTLALMRREFIHIKSAVAVVVLTIYGHSNMPLPTSRLIAMRVMVHNAPQAQAQPVQPARPPVQPARPPVQPARPPPQGRAGPSHSFAQRSRSPRRFLQARPTPSRTRGINEKAQVRSSSESEGTCITLTLSAARSCRDVLCV